MMFSFIIPTRNEGDYLEGCLRSILNQERKNFEIIVVDTQSIDKTKKIAKRYGARIIEESKKGPSAARNKGANHSSGQILIFCDADVRFEKDFLEKVEKKFIENIGGCTFKLHPYDANKKIYELAYDYANKIAKFLNKIGLTITTGSCFAYRKDVFIRSGGFNEMLLTNEDHDLAIKVNKVKRFMFFEDILIETSSRRVSKLGFVKVIKVCIKSTLLYAFNRSYLRDYW